MWVLITLAGLLAVFLILLSVPLETTIRLEVYGKPRLRLRMTWLFGLVRWEIKPGKKKGPAETGEQAPGKKKTSPWTLLRLLGTRGLIKSVACLVKDILLCFHFKDFRADFRVGLDDPADTGMLFAVFGPLTPFLPHTRLVPASDEATCEGYLTGAVSVTPLSLGFPVLRFIFSPPALRTARAMMVSRWKKK